MTHVGATRIGYLSRGRPRRRLLASSGTTREEIDMTGIPGPLRGDRAVVIGGSIAGLACAAELARRFRQVTVVDRDRLPATGEHRRGVPQYRHTHLLLPAGLRGLTELLPGFDDAL